MQVSDLPTPALLLDRPRFEANCARMRASVAALGVGLRPHMKTLKSIDAARVAIDPGHGGIAVSTLAEAEYFAGHGICDIQLAVCIAPDKLNRAASVLAMAPGFSFFVDAVATADAVATFARREGVIFHVWIEVDCGQHRTGVDPQGDALLAIAGRLDGARLSGIATHGGHSYSERTAEAIARVAEQERSAATAAADRLRAAGRDVPGVSAGSTPTAVHSRSALGLTELRPGVYMAGDLFQAAIGSQGIDDMAVSVLATVVSHSGGKLVLDAGGLALSKDRSTAALDGGDMGYGVVADLAGERTYGNLIVAVVNQEHGEAPLPDSATLSRFPIGAKVRVFPNHVCMTAAAYDRFHVTDGDHLVGEWGKTGGW